MPDVHYPSHEREVFPRAFPTSTDKTRLPDATQPSALDKYDVLSRVGEGSFGVVHQCRLKTATREDAPLAKFAHLAGRLLAIKKFRTEGQDDIALREIKMLKVTPICPCRNPCTDWVACRLCRVTPTSFDYMKCFDAKDGSTW